MNKKKRVGIILFVGIVLLVLLIIIGMVVVASAGALLGQADNSIGRSIGNIFQAVWGYAVDFVSALWKQIIANPLQFITGGNG